MTDRAGEALELREAALATHEGIFAVAYSPTSSTETAIVGTCAAEKVSKSFRRSPGR